MSMEIVASALRECRIEVEEIGGTLNVSKGSGLMARKANLDPNGVLERIDEATEIEARRLAAGYASGVEAVLLEPKRSKARDWTFVESAGSVLPRLEVRTFVDGVRDACGEEAWHEELADDVVLAWGMRLDHGSRVVTAPQFEDWGVSRDRVVAAARSLLFHMTRHAEWENGEWPESVYGLRVGDGWDSGRLLVIEDVFFSQVGSEWRFAVPKPDLVLAVATPDASEALAATAHEVYREAAYPLSDKVWCLRGGKPHMDG